jgi:hypothetical protein
MLRDLNPAQTALAQYMSDLSEEAYCAGWMMGLEYALWQVVLGLRTDYGRLAFTSEHVAELREFSASCGGWIVFDDEREETWIPRKEWEARFQAWLTSPAAKRTDG